MTNGIKRSLLGLFTLSFAVLPASFAGAEDWMTFTSPSGVYQVRMPEGLKSSSTQFLVDDDRAVHSEETSVLIDQRPYQNTMKSYIVKFDQTFGPALTGDNVSQLLHEEFQSYINYYSQFEGVVKHQDTEGYNGHWGGDIMISYKDKEFGQQTIRARILYGDDTRLQQIIIGSDDLMNSFATRDFMDTLIFDPGVSIVKGRVNEKWLTMESPTGMFTLLYPGEKAPPYFTTPPKASWDDKNEIVAAVFHDPVRNENVYFNVYGYKFNTDLDFPAIQEILTKRHINKYRSATKGIRFAKGIGDPKEEGMLKYPFMETTYPIKPPKNLPYISNVRLRSYHLGKNMIVMETMTSNALFTSSLVSNLMSFVNFQPDKMHDAVQPATPTADVPAPIDTTRPEDQPAVPSKLRPGQKESDPKPVINLSPTPKEETPKQAPPEAPAAPETKAAPEAAPAPTAPAPAAPATP
jgi:hypothetical protein